MTKPTYLVRASLYVTADTPAYAQAFVRSILDGDESPCGLETPMVRYRITSATLADPVSQRPPL